METVENVSMEETQARLERRLKEAMEARESTEASVNWTRKELDRLFGKKGPKKPTETVSDIEMKIADLELKRTINSMTLQEERIILKQIHKLKLLKNQIDEYMKFEKTIKSKKEAMGNLRASLKEQRTSIAEIKTELGTVNMAVALGCGVSDLLGTKMDCPESEMGRIIGKKGKNIQNLMKTTNTNVDVEKTDIRLIGTFDSLQAAKTNLEKTITRTEENITVSSQLIQLLTAAKITALQNLREKHPDVWFQVNRGNTNILARGTPSDIRSLKNELEQFELVEESLELTSRESGLLVGKKGANVANLVEKYQVSIEVEKTMEGQETSTTTIIGPTLNVALVKADIETLLNDNKETELLIPIHEYVKTVLLLQSGAGIQALQKQVNQDADAFIPVSFSGDSVLIKGRAKYMAVAEQIVRDEVKRIESQIRTVQFDPVAIPLLIGKRGEAIKELRQGTQVTIEVGRSSGQVAVCGMNAEEVSAVLSKIEAVKTSNQVQRIKLMDCDTVEDFSNRYRNFLRSAEQKQVRDLVFVLGDDDAREIVLRGDANNLKEAGAIVENFLAGNFIEKLSISSEDLTALLTGGKKSKMVELADAIGVNLHADRDRQLVVATGEKEKVVEAVKLVREYLYGSADMVVRKIDLGRSELMGVVIGRGGKTKLNLEQKFPSLSILVPRSETTITLRGDATQVQDCEVEIMKLVASATVTRTMELKENQLLKLKTTGFNRRLGALASVNVQLSSEKSIIKLRGTSSSCEEALVLLKEELDGVYETRMKIGSVYNRFKASCSNPSHLNRIMEESNATVFIDDETSSVVFHGTRQQVHKAKESLLSFLDFLLGENMHRYFCEKQILSIVGTLAAMAEVSVRSGADVIVDMQVSSILVFSAEAEKVKTAVDLLKEKAKDGEKLVHTFQLDESEDWLIAKIVGQRGSSIAKLRKSTGCAIEVVSKERRIVVSAGNAETVTKAKETLANLIETSRKECSFVSFPSADDLPAFVGRAGTKINEFSKKHGVEVQIMKSQGDVVRISGDESKVLSARTDLEAWIADRVAERNEKEDVTTKQVRPNQISAVIGQKGAVIKGLRKEFKCRIEVDSATATISVRGASPETAEALFAKIDSIIGQNNSEAETKQLQGDQLPAIIGTKGATINALQKEFDCKLDIDRNTAVLSIRGVSDENREALYAKIDAIASREGQQDENQQIEMKQLKEDDVPAVIGARGNVINSLQHEFRCKIDIDKSTSLLTVRGGTAQAREALFAKIDRIIIGEEKAEAEAQPIKRNVDRENTRSQNKQPKEAIEHKAMVESDFPSLAPHSKCKEEAPAGARWSSIVSDPSHDVAELDLMD